MSDAISLDEAIQFVSAAKELRWQRQMKLNNLMNHGPIGPPGMTIYGSLTEVLAELKKIEADIISINERILKVTATELSVVSEEIRALANRLNIVKV